MDIKPYKSGRKGHFNPLAFSADDGSLPRGTAAARAESHALDARIDQEDAFCHEANGSLKYLLLLNGVLPSPATIRDNACLQTHLDDIAPGSSPGSCGPIAILLIL